MGSIVSFFSFFFFFFFFFFSKAIAMKIFKLTALSLALCCLAQSGEGLRCWQSKIESDLIEKGFERSMLKKVTCPADMSLCVSLHWLDPKMKAVRSLQSCADQGDFA